MPTSSHPPIQETLDSLDLESLDAQSLFEALTKVERALPSLLLCVKPVLAQLSQRPQASSDFGAGGAGGSGAQASNGYGHGDGGDGDGGVLAKEGIENYMALLDKIQYILRQTTYYLRETGASPSTLIPPNPSSIPTPFASTLTKDESNLPEGGAKPPSYTQDWAELGLYASRIEARTLGELAQALNALQRPDPSAMSVDGYGSPRS